MIDFQSIRNELNKISDFIGGEKYIQFKTSDNINVYNKYDLESNNLIVNKEKLLLYQTDTPFTENDLYLLQIYKKIYSVNNTIKHTNIVSLPLGIVDTANDISFATCYKTRNFSLYQTLCLCRNSFIGNPQKLLYLNYRVPNDLMVRKNALNIKNKLDHEQYTDNTINGQNWLLFDSQDNYIQYFNKCLNHIFIQCPEGYGIDSYRFYETLYLGRIPVVLHNPVTDMFQDLPILFLNDWNDFNDVYKDFIDNFNINNYNFEKLSWDYWKRIINE